MESGINFTSNLGSNPGIELDTPRFKVYSFGGRVTSGGGKFEADNCMYNTIKNSLFNSASLIVTPNSSQEGKLYSVIPSDGSGDMSVTRATTATRVNSAGLVELVPYNLLTWSQDFSNATWLTSAGVTLTSGQTDFNGGNTAFRIQMTSASNYLANVFSSISGGVYTHSIYVKSNTGTSQNFRMIDGVTGVSGGVFNGTATTEWQRFQVTITTNSANAAFQLDNNSGAYATDLLICFAQSVEGSTSKPYQKTETRLNIPRLDYSNGTCPSLLVEPQRTNLITYSEQFNQWSPQAIGTASLPVVTSNAAIAPNGLQVADKIVFNSGSGTGAFDWSFIISNSFSTSAASYTGSIYLKGENGGEQIQIRHAASSSYTKLTLTTEWQRFDTIETGTGGSANMELAIRRDLNEPMNATATIYAWAAQEELGSYATSYIPTTSASVTRNADVISKTGISSLIGTSEGSAFFEGVIDDTGSALSAVFFEVVNGTSTTNTIVLYIDTTTGKIGLYLGVTGTLVFLSSTSFKGQNAKIAFRWKANDYAFYLNGTQVYTNTSAAAPSGMNALRIGNNRDGQDIGKNEVKASALWTTALTNDELATLTTI
jgi:hypothetical protein